MTYYISVRWWYGICYPAFPHQYCLVFYRLPTEFRNRAGIYSFFASTFHSVAQTCIGNHIWTMLTLLSSFLSFFLFFFFLIRWISKLVAVQKLVVFFKKKTNSFSNILWNCFIHFIFKPNVSRVLLLLSSNFDM